MKMIIFFKYRKKYSFQLYKDTFDQMCSIVHSYCSFPKNIGACSSSLLKTYYCVVCSVWNLIHVAVGSNEKARDYCMVQLVVLPVMSRELQPNPITTRVFTTKIVEQSFLIISFYSSCLSCSSNH